jgi:hypothetical protein
VGIEAKVWPGRDGSRFARAVISSVLIRGSFAMPNPETGLSCVLDGITVQHSGELLFATRATTSERSACAATYVRSLEDFAFALLYGASFTVSGSMPEVAGENPGRLLIEEYPQWHVNLDDGAPARPDVLLKTDPAFRARVAATLRRVPNSYLRIPEFWEHFILREARSSLIVRTDAVDGEKRNRQEASAAAQRKMFASPHTAPSEFIYGKVPEYFVDPELQAELDDRSFTRKLSARLAMEWTIRHGIPEVILEEFVRRATLAHVVIYWWSELSVGGHLAQVIRVPHVTRSLLCASEPRTGAVRRGEFQKRTRVRNVLHECLSRHVIERHELVNVLGGLRERKDIAATRADFGRLAEIEADSSPVELASRRYETVLDDIGARAGDEFSGELTLYPASRLPSPRSRKALRRAQGIEMIEYRRQLYCVFPELESRR